MGTRKNRLADNPTIYVLNRNMKKYQCLLSENFQFLKVKFSIQLNRRTFVTENSFRHSFLFCFHEILAGVSLINH